MGEAEVHGQDQAHAGGRAEENERELYPRTTVPFFLLGVPTLLL
jgi:hypothetical protein